MIEISLPSGRTDVVLSKLSIEHMGTLYNAQHYEQATSFINVIQKLVNVDIREMYLEDFRYLLAFIDRDSWTQGHRIFEWRCSIPYYVTYDNQRHLDIPTGRRFDVVDCKTLNTEETANTKITYEKWRTLPAGMVYPTVGRWEEAQAISEELGNDVFDAMWMDSDLDLRTTLSLMSYRDQLEIRANKYQICHCETQLKCSVCLRQYKNKQPLDLLNFLRVYSDLSMMNIQHDLAVHRKVLVPTDTPFKQLLYWHGMLVKDIQKAEEERTLNRNKGKRR